MNIIDIISFINIILQFIFVPILSRSLIAMMCRKRSIQASAKDDETRHLLKMMKILYHLLTLYCNSFSYQFYLGL